MINPAAARVLWTGGIQHRPGLNYPTSFREKDGLSQEFGDTTQALLGGHRVGRHSASLPHAAILLFAAFVRTRVVATEGPSGSTAVSMAPAET